MEQKSDRRRFSPSSRFRNRGQSDPGIAIQLLALPISYGGVLTFVAVYATELSMPFVTHYFFVVTAGATVISRFATGRLLESLSLDCAVYQP